MNKKKKSVTPIANGNAVDLVGLFEADDRVIKLSNTGNISIKRPGRVLITIWVDFNGHIVISGDDTIDISPRAANSIHIL